MLNVDSMNDIANGDTTSGLLKLSSISIALGKPMDTTEAKEKSVADEVREFERVSHRARAGGYG